MCAVWWPRWPCGGPKATILCVAWMRLVLTGGTSLSSRPGEQLACSLRPVQQWAALSTPIPTAYQTQPQPTPAPLHAQADRIHCEGFALRIFDNADRVDRAGKATERTSKAYYAASIFIEVREHCAGVLHCTGRGVAERDAGAKRPSQASHTAPSYTRDLYGTSFALGE